jgi:hypothetical protein
MQRKVASCFSVREKTEGFSQCFGKGVVVIVSGVASFLFFCGGGGGATEITNLKNGIFNLFYQYPLYFAR